MKRKKLGQMAAEAGLITDKQLSDAIADHKQSNMKLGQFLVKKGIVREQEIVDLLSRQVDIKRYSPSQFPVNTSLADVFTFEMANKYKAAPLQRNGNVLTIAITDPSDIDALDAIEIYTNMEVETLICTEKEIDHLITTIYGNFSGLGVIMEDEHFDFDDYSEEGQTIEDIEVSSLLNMAEEAPVIRLVNSILSQAIRERASDVHISPEKTYVHIRFRVDGKLYEVPSPPKKMFLPIVSRMKILANLDIAVSRIPQDGRFTIKMNGREINVRTSTIPTIHGENVVLRLLDSSSNILTLEELGFSANDRAIIRRMINKPYGMILTAGPTGSGKSTTLYSMLRELNTPDTNIMTLEDPVEYRMEKVRQTQLNKKAGMTFSEGIKSILRQDPDVIMVGETRDRETAEISIQAGLTGHRVLSTVHTNDAAGAITRFIDMGIEPFLVSSVMLMTISQRLLRRVCPECKVSVKPSQRALDFWEIKDTKGANFVKGRGCSNCMDTGYKGRIGIYEILVMDEMVQDMVLNNCSARQITQAVKKAGKIKLLRESAAQKVFQGETSMKEAAAAVMS
ncbi:MAG: GspE/PulE family protein [Proteobacteria bacterium]|nr:GspE/PulE family protein [Pseudomonadota bacterium]MBU1389546.1 GspE/PulE family protein [Pseudomonadota bacterium]MBU1544410.1 GspE/PulE family protein [Pseudomonadota bacterium]MBU2480684.1 GspE/PulE family protein [Pseudomonadota bacterium]